MMNLQILMLMVAALLGATTVLISYLEYRELKKDTKRLEKSVERIKNLLRSARREE